MKFYLFNENVPLVYIDDRKYEETEPSLEYMKKIQGDTPFSLLSKQESSDEFGTNIPFEFYTFLLKAYPGGVRKPWHFIRNFTSTGFCLSDEVKELFSTYNLPKHEYYIMHCEFRGDSYTYWWFRIHVKPTQTLIDFDKSTFRIYEPDNKPFTTIEEWNNRPPLKFEIVPLVKECKEKEYILTAMLRHLDSEATAGIYMEELYISREIERYDMFCLSHYPSIYLVSERLKNEMEKHKFKGIKFEEATWLKIIE